jgi:hypothetical protein
VDTFSGSAPDVTLIFALTVTVSPTAADAGGCWAIETDQSWRLFEPTVSVCTSALVGLVPVVAGMNVTFELLETVDPLVTFFTVAE